MYIFVNDNLSKLNDMKTQLILLFGLIILFIAPKQSICRELNSINFEVKRNYKFNNFNQDTTLVFDAFIGKYPKFYGLIKALDSIENTINKILQGGVPYKVFSSVNNIPQETYSIKNGVFTYKIILNRCEEKNRYWKFGIAGAFYLADTLITSNNDKEPSLAGSEVRWLLNDKANNWNSIGVTQLSPNNISREDANKYILERNKHIDLDNSSSKTVSSQHDAFTNGHLFFTCGSLFGIVSNKALLEDSKVDIKSPNIKYLYSLVYQDESIKSNYSKNNKVLQNKASNSIVSNNNSKNIDGNKAYMDTLLMYEALIKKSKASPEVKRKLLVELNKSKKQLQELQLVGKAADEALNNLFNTGNANATFTPKNCWHCNGTGLMKTCTFCDGRGIVYCSGCNGRRYLSDGRVCLNCSGEGILVCHVCNGKKFNIKCNHKIRR